MRIILQYIKVSIMYNMLFRRPMTSASAGLINKKLKNKIINKVCLCGNEVKLQFKLYNMK